jgi:hypothetical protein
VQPVALGRLRTVPTDKDAPPKFQFEHELPEGTIVLELSHKGFTPDLPLYLGTKLTTFWALAQHVLEVRRVGALKTRTFSQVLCVLTCV